MGQDCTKSGIEWHHFGYGTSHTKFETPRLRDCGLALGFLGVAITSPPRTVDKLAKNYFHLNTHFDRLRFSNLLVLTAGLNSS